MTSDPHPSPLATIGEVDFPPLVLSELSPKGRASLLRWWIANQPLTEPPWKWLLGTGLLGLTIGAVGMCAFLSFR